MDDQARACFNIALNYYDGLGVRANKAKALFYNDKSCELGEPKACYNSAYMYETGEGDKIDLPRATELYRYSCDELSLIHI